LFFFFFFFSLFSWATLLLPLRQEAKVVLAQR